MTTDRQATAPAATAAADGNDEVRFERVADLGLVTLCRPRALNALSLGMVRALTAQLLAWRDDPAVAAVVVRGMGRGDGGAPQPFGAFCAGGDIRFFHAAALAGDPALEDFFTEEYRLNHLVHHYPKPYVTLLDGVCMGGGMGLAGHRGARALRIVTERTRMAMPETRIGLFPDVGGGWFLARCPGRLGEYLALTGQTFGAADALHVGLADLALPAAELPALWADLQRHGSALLQQRLQPTATTSIASVPELSPHQAEIDRFFALDSAVGIVEALQADGGSWAQGTAAVLRQMSPLMLEVTLQQLRRARGLTLAEALRMERGLVRHCFHPRHLARHGAGTEVVEGVRALAIDKDHSPRWNPARLEDVTPAMVEPFFSSPWPAHAHPLALLGAA